MMEVYFSRLLAQRLSRAEAVEIARQAGMEMTMALSREQRAEQDAIVQRIGRCMAGDADAWHELVTGHHRRIYYLCYNFTKSWIEAEDLTQDVFLKLFCNLGSFDTERGSFYHWLQNITRNHLVDQFRRSRVARATESLDVSFDGAGSGPTMADHLADSRPMQDEWLTQLEVKEKVHAALEKLSTNSREVVMFCDLQELNYREAAEILGIPEGTVKSRLSRGRTELARLLSPAREVRSHAKVEVFRQKTASAGRDASRLAQRSGLPGSAKEMRGEELLVRQVA